MTAFPINDTLPRSYLALTISMMTCLILLINVSFKIIAVHGMIFTASSIICPLVSIIYLFVLKECNIIQQRHILNQSLLALYLFSIGTYLLVNLPAAEHMYDNPAYQIIFEDMPKKFFAATLSFGLSFYLPHFFYCARQNNMFILPKRRLLFALLGGYSFFSMNFLLLFLDPHIDNFNRIYIDSLMVSAGILLGAGVIYLIALSSGKYGKKTLSENWMPTYLSSSLYHYLVGISVSVLLISLACEYRLVSLTHGWTLAASSILFPFTLIASNLIGELFGYKANLRFAIVLMFTELFFDGLLIAAAALPAPDFFNLNPFYNAILMPRRIPAGVLALFGTFVINAILLEKLKYAKLRLSRGVRFLIANLVATTILCTVNYSILYCGIYPYEQIFNLALNVWSYKLIVTLVSLPFLLHLYSFCQKHTGTVDTLRSENKIITPLS